MYSVLTERRVPTAGRDDILKNDRRCLRRVSVLVIVSEHGGLFTLAKAVCLRHFSHRLHSNDCATLFTSASVRRLHTNYFHKLLHFSKA